MTCQTCGRPAENGQETHWLGCPAAQAPYAIEEAHEGDDPVTELCVHPGCRDPKKEWSGKGAKPKYCAAGHKKEKRP